MSTNINSSRGNSNSNNRSRTTNNNSNSNNRLNNNRYIYDMKLDKFVKKENLSNNQKKVNAEPPKNYFKNFTILPQFENTFITPKNLNTKMTNVFNTPKNKPIPISAPKILKRKLQFGNENTQPPNSTVTPGKPFPILTEMNVNVAKRQKLLSTPPKLNPELNKLKNKVINYIGQYRITRQENKRALINKILLTNTIIPELPELKNISDKNARLIKNAVNFHFGYKTPFVNRRKMKPDNFRTFTNPRPVTPNTPYKYAGLNIIPFNEIKPKSNKYTFRSDLGNLTGIKRKVNKNYPTYLNLNYNDVGLQQFYYYYKEDALQFRGDSTDINLLNAFFIHHYSKKLLPKQKKELIELHEANLSYYILVYGYDKDIDFYFIETLKPLESYDKKAYNDITNFIRTFGKNANLRSDSLQEKKKFYNNYYKRIVNSTFEELKNKSPKERSRKLNSVRLQKGLPPSEIAKIKKMLSNSNNKKKYLIKVNEQ